MTSMYCSLLCATQGSSGREASGQACPTHVNSRLSGYGQIGHGNGHDGHHDHGHGHGGHDHKEQLHSIRRWLDGGLTDIEQTFPMYDIMLSSMRSHFAHAREERTISVKAYGFLNAAVGVGLDANEDQMHVHAAEGSGGVSRMTTMEQKKDSPLDACVDFVIDLAANGLNAANTASVLRSNAHHVFHHHMLCAEMFMVLIDELNELADAENGQSNSDLGGFCRNAADCARRGRVQLAASQLTSPNTFQACHTLLAFNQLAGEFHHRVHAYED